MSVWTEIVCDVCAETFGDGGNSPVALRRYARRNGWTKRIKDGRLNDYCPNCKEGVSRVICRDAATGAVATRKDGQP